eukprot:616316-Pelagomonas_calceolata.AAC.5
MRRCLRTPHLKRWREGMSRNREQRKRRENAVRKFRVFWWTLQILSLRKKVNEIDLGPRKKSVLRYIRAAMAQLCMKSFGRIDLKCVLECSKGGKGGNVVKNGNFPPTPLCQIYPQVCSNDIADIIAKEMGSVGGLRGSGWARTSWGGRWTSKPASLISLREHSPGAFSLISYVQPPCLNYAYI